MGLALSWEPGEQIRFRYVREERAFWTLPVTVAADEPGLLALWIAPETPNRRPLITTVGISNLATGRWKPVGRNPRGGRAGTSGVAVPDRLGELAARSRLAAADSA